MKKFPAKTLDKSLTKRYNGVNETARVLRTERFSALFSFFSILRKMLYDTTQRRVDPP